MVIFNPMETLVGWVNSPAGACISTAWRRLDGGKPLAAVHWPKWAKTGFTREGVTLGWADLFEAGAGGLACACLSRHRPGAQSLFGFDEERFSMRVSLAVPFVLSEA